MAIDKDIPITAAKMFENYLYRIGLNRKTMNPVQYNEMRKAHYAAISSMMVVILSPKLEEKELHVVMGNLTIEVRQFWADQKKKA